MKKTLIILLVVLFAAGSAFAQKPDMAEMLVKASERSAKYIETFRNLIANETRTVVTLRPDGTVRRQKSIDSTFIVYQLASDGKQVVEFRHVTAVDGKKRGNADRRAHEFFEKLSASENSKIELDRIRKESFRHDDVIVDGYTLFQGVPLFDNLREKIAFEFVGRDPVNGRDTISIRYMQSESNPAIRFSGKDEPGRDDAVVDVDVDEQRSEALKPRLRGTLWLDANTFDIVKEVREITAQPEGVNEPIVISRAEFDYVPSEFGIFTPSLIKVSLNKLQKDRRSALPEGSVTLKYGKFSNPEVEVRSAEIKN